MKKIFLLVLVLLACFVAVAFAVDVVAVVPASVAVAAVPGGGVVAWFKTNTVAVLAVALALSELLSLIPAFQGNGILDSIVKGLRALSGKNAA